MTTSKKSNSRGRKQPSPKTSTSSKSASSAPDAVPATVSYEPPHPRDLLAEAMEMPNHSNIRNYVDTIRVLKTKGLSYREIAEWLSERGVDADHNAVYRAFMKSLPAEEQYQQELQDEEEAREEMERSW